MGVEIQHGNRPLGQQSVLTRSHPFCAIPLPHPLLTQVTEGPIDLQTRTSLGCGRKPEYPEETNTVTERTCKLHADSTRGQDGGSSSTRCTTDNVMDY